jgi:sulfur carrier protein
VQVVINGTSREITENTTLQQVLDEYGVPERGVAVAVDGTVVPRTSWPTTTLSPDAGIEVLTAVQGG